MKFKTKEELIADKYNHGIGLAYQNGEESGIIIAFKSFAERVEFYKKYDFEPAQLNIDYPDIVKKYEKEWDTIIGYGIDDKCFDYGAYTDWLFDYCFGDVIE